MQTPLNTEYQTLTVYFNIHASISLQSSSNHWMSLTLHHKYKPFYYLSYDQRSIMICLSNPAYYRGNPHSYHSRPYTSSYSGPYGNCYHKETSLTTSDQTQLSQKSMKTINQACSPESVQFYPIIYPPESDVQKFILISMIFCNQSKLQK